MIYITSSTTVLTRGLDQGLSFLSNHRRTMSFTTLLAAFGAGVASHLFYFNRSEHHFYGLRYTQLVILAFFAAPIHVAEKEGGGFGVQYSPSPARWQAITIFLAGLYTSLLTYRAFFHPLNKFPGPFGARISDLWYSSGLTKADAPHKLVQLHKRYGECRAQASFMVCCEIDAQFKSLGQPSR